MGPGSRAGLSIFGSNPGVEQDNSGVRVTPGDSTTAAVDGTPVGLCDQRITIFPVFCHFTTGISHYMNTSVGGWLARRAPCVGGIQYI